MRDERAALDAVGGSGALCAGVAVAAEDVVAFMTRFWCGQYRTKEDNEDACVNRERKVFPMIDVHQIPSTVQRSDSLRCMGPAFSSFYRPDSARRTDWL
jgi:hypothetical protein